MEWKLEPELVHSIYKRSSLNSGEYKQGNSTEVVSRSRRRVDFGQGPDDLILRSSGPWRETEINTASGDAARTRAVFY